MSTLSRFQAAMVVALAVPTHLLAQNVHPSEPKLAAVVGTVTDVNADPVPNATIEVKTYGGNDRRIMVTPENGFFKFYDARPGVCCESRINAKDFADWTSTSITLEPGQFEIVTGIQLRIRPALTGMASQLTLTKGRP